MPLPYQTEVYDDPSSVRPPQFPYQQTPQVFLFSQPATEHLDLDTATTLAWRLRGLALLLLVHRCATAPVICMSMDINMLRSFTLKCILLVCVSPGRAPQ